MLAGLSLTAAAIVAQASEHAPCAPTESAANDWRDQNEAQTAPQVGAGELLFPASPADRAVPLSDNRITMRDPCAGTNQHMRVIGSALD